MWYDRTMTENKRTEWDWTTIWLDVAATAFSIAAAIILWRILQLIASTKGSPGKGSDSARGEALLTSRIVPRPRATTLSRPLRSRTRGHLYCK